jgi:hypothetical protein
MSLHKLTAGSGYDYLTRQVAALDATDRLDESPEPSSPDRARSLDPTRRPDALLMRRVSATTTDLIATRLQRIGRAAIGLAIPARQGRSGISQIPLGHLAPRRSWANPSQSQSAFFAVSMVDCSARPGDRQPSSRSFREVGA